MACTRLTEAPQLDQGFITELERWRSSVPVPTLVVIDVLQRIKPAGSMARNSYENDYSAWAPLQQWATENRVAVLGLHYTKKGGADDPLEALSGSNGLSACADKLRCYFLGIHSGYGPVNAIVRRPAASMALTGPLY
jgi:hypothetical protein